MREYFESITDVCPFSLESFDAGRIPVLKYNPELVESMYHELEHYDAILFKVHTSICRQVLSTTADELSDTYPDAEWFWSHPADGHKSTVVPVLLMQNREHLTSARKKFKLMRNGSKMANKQKENIVCKKEDVNR